MAVRKLEECAPAVSADSTQKNPALWPGFLIGSHELFLHKQVIEVQVIECFIKGRDPLIDHFVKST